MCTRRLTGSCRKRGTRSVDGMVVFEVLALLVFAALPPGVEPDEERPDVVLRAFTDHEAIACQAAGLVDQGRGGRPAGIVEHGVVQRRQDVLKGVLVVLVVHDDFPPLLWPTLGDERHGSALDAIGLSHETAFAQLDVHNPRQLGDPGIRTVYLIQTRDYLSLAE